MENLHQAETGGSAAGLRQAASVIDFILSRAGDPGLREIMRRIAGGSSPEGAREAIQQVLGLPFPEFSEKWKESLAKKGLKEMDGVHARRYKIKEGKSDEERVEMNEVKSMIARNRAHLGDRLKERGRMEAASWSTAGPWRERSRCGPEPARRSHPHQPKR
jgi:hypothetical protein